MSDTNVLTLDGAVSADSASLGGDANPSAMAALAQREPGSESSATGLRATGDRTRSVPYGALAEERARRKELQRELQQSLETRQHLQGRLELLQAVANGQRPETGQEEGAAVSLVESEPGLAGVMPPAPPLETEFHSPADAAFRTQVLQSIRAFSAEQPDFPTAYEHARERRIAELMTLGYGPDEAVAITFDNELEVIRNAYANGRNPAQVIYDYALQRGYKGTGSPREPSGAPPQAPAARPGQRGLSEAEKVALAARGQAGSKSLSSAGGAAAGTLTLEALASLSDDEFAEATGGDRWRRLLRE